MIGFKKVSVSLVAIAILIRWLVGQFPHSGQQTPPLYGDYEAQRHWMEITTNLHIKEWYQNSTDNDLLYWGLDYPPLTAYHMYILGYTSNEFLNASWTELHKSRGIETYHHKIYMRLTVIFSELLIYIPAIIYYFYKTSPIQYISPPSPVHSHNIAIYTALVLLYPAQILIDHGHFQYNSVFMGLVVWAIISMIQNKQILSAILFTLALTYKQMSLYYSLPFFWYLASVNLRVKPLWKGVRNILVIGVVVLLSMATIFAPFLQSIDATRQVIQRIFPFDRGLFEDKVANVWFSLSIFYKFRQAYSINELLRASSALTLLFSLPAGIHLLCRPTIRNFKYALITTSMVFFLFSFQVHEKTILVPALPLLLLAREHPMATNWFVVVSTFSLQPLLMKDGQLVPYFVLMTIYILLSMEIFRGLTTISLTKLISLDNFIILTNQASVAACCILSVLAIIIEPPERYPHIHPTVNALFCCTHFIGFLFFYYIREFKPLSQHQEPVSRVCLIKKTD